MPILEVIATSLGDALSAEKGGAESIEIITNLDVGGLTPDFNLVQAIVNQVTVDTHVIIRPHADTFVYSPADKETMVDSIRQFRNLPITSIVIGGMTEAGDFDFDFLDEITRLIDPDRITIHRVIDHVNDPLADLMSLSKLISRVLSSGLPTNAYEGRFILQKIQNSFGHDIQFKCGGGITFENIEEILAVVNMPIFHTGQAVRTDDKVDVEKVRRMVDIIK